MYTQIDANKRKTVLLVIAFLALTIGLGWLFGKALGNDGIAIGVLIGAIVYASFGYFASAQIALALSGAREITKAANPRLWRTVENLSIAAGLPMPKVYLIDDPAPNAFATGRDPAHSAVATTTGLVDIMSDQELEGVIGHELSHVGNYDIRVMGVVLVLVTIVAVASDVFLRMMWFRDNRDSNGGAFLVLLGVLAAVIAPLVAVLLKMAVSRKREYLADASGALLTRYPEGLAGALEKIGSYDKPMRSASTATAHLFIANPLKTEKGKPRGMSALFSTHPPIHERVRILRKMGRSL